VTGVNAGVDVDVDVDVDVGGSVDAESCVCVGFDTDDAFRTPVVTSSRTRVNSPELLVYPLISPSTATVPF
jgi:hypothetical protein